MRISSGVSILNINHLYREIVSEVHLMMEVNLVDILFNCIIIGSNGYHSFFSYSCAPISGVHCTISGVAIGASVGSLNQGPQGFQNSANTSINFMYTNLNLK